MNSIVTLRSDEIDEVIGGFIPLLVLAVTIVLAAAGGGYMVGKDMAERDNRTDA